MMRLLLFLGLSVIIGTSLFMAFGGSDRLLQRYGPVTLWLKGWDGEETIPDPRAEHELILHPASSKPEILAVKVEATPGDSARFLLPDGTTLASLPDDRGRLRVVDWYGGDCTIRYIPGKVSGEGIRVKWVFGSSHD
ncbi:MAG: hypothetical protein K1Y02_00310 [Candidatus Hydrogenedentes bacterium]|nr:hypothetical protein [Candidatus Hydrogenedentota bacterium]